MRMNKTQIYIAAYLAILIPTPGRFVYGLTIMLEILLLAAVGLLMNALIKQLKMEKLRTAILITTMVAFSIFYRQLFTIFQTELSLTLGYIFYLPAVSLFTIGLLYEDKDKTIIERAGLLFTKVAIFCISGLFFFLFRDIAGFGTFTFYGPNHQIFEKVLFNPETVGIFTFFASIPGALILSGLALFVNILVRQQLDILEKGEANK